MPLSLKRKLYVLRILSTMTHGCLTWSLTKALVQILRTAQNALERKMLKVKIQNKIPDNKMG